MEGVCWNKHPPVDSHFRSSEQMLQPGMLQRYEISPIPHDWVGRFFMVLAPNYKKLVETGNGDGVTHYYSTFSSRILFSRNEDSGTQSLTWHPLSLQQQKNRQRHSR